jgi:branched-chain amino acid transport system substrate-binding protein
VKKVRSTATLLTIGVIAATSLAACGSSKSSSGSSGSSYTIAYEGPLSGGNQQLGLNELYSVELAINQANAGTSAFGKLPFTLKFTKQDDMGTADGAPTAAQTLIADSSVVAVVGPAFSGATKAAEPYFSQADLATVSPSATNPALATSGWKNFFRVLADDNAQGPADAEYLGKVVKATSVYLVDDASSYATGLATAFKGAAAANGLTITAETAPGTTQCQAGNGNVQQYAALSAKVKSANPSAVFYAGYYCDLALFAKALRSAGYTGTIMSGDGSDDPTYIKQAGASVAEGTLLSCACAELATTGAAATFASGFKALAGFSAGTYSGEAYDATNAIISVMKQLATSGQKITRSAIVTGLTSVDYQGLTKTVKFTTGGNIAGTAVYVNKVENGVIDQLGLVSALASS